MSATTPDLYPTGVFSAAAHPGAGGPVAGPCRLRGNTAATCWTMAADGVAMLGTTGEANSFSGSERRALLESRGGRRHRPGTPAARHRRGRADRDGGTDPKHALSQGVTTVVMLPPFYYKNISDDGLFASYAGIVIERVADPRLRVVLYHIPMFSAVPIPPAVIERLRAAFPGVFVGLKDSSGDLANMEMLVERFPGFAVLAGADPLMLPLLRKGGAGCITATSNLVARDLAFVFRNFRDPAQAAAVDAAQARIVAARNRVSVFAQIASLKTLLAQKTGNADWGTVRPPLLPLTQDEMARL